jgi:hypothetical protein
MRGRIVQSQEACLAGAVGIWEEKTFFCPGGGRMTMYSAVLPSVQYPWDPLSNPRLVLRSAVHGKVRAQLFLAGFLSWLVALNGCLTPFFIFFRL